MKFVSLDIPRARLEGRRVVIVGSGPGVLDNDDGFIDGHDVVIRVNNYRLSSEAGFRCDIFYSFFGNSIRKTRDELAHDGVTLCICKCPNAHAIQSEWHRRHGLMAGVDFRWIYAKRAGWWFCDTYLPEPAEFMAVFEMLGGHVPTTGFSAIQFVLGCKPAALHLTGFDFFRSGIHNVTEHWGEKNVGDPIGHVPEVELQWLRDHMFEHPITCDPRLMRALARRKHERRTESDVPIQRHDLSGVPQNGQRVPLHRAPRRAFLPRHRH